jgi:hypothetical protein
MTQHQRSPSGTTQQIPIVEIIEIKPHWHVLLPTAHVRMYTQYYCMTAYYNNE